MPNAEFEQLPAQLARQLAPLYLIHGEEALLTLEAADAIRAAARAAGYLEREVLSVEAGFDWSQLIAASQSISLFASLKLLEIRIPNGKPGNEGSEALQAFAKALPPDTITLIVLPKLDKAQQQGKWFSALAAAGQVLEARALGRAELPGWIARRLAAQRITLSSEALGFFAERVEGNLLAARQEVDKLALLYPDGAELDLDAVRAAVASVARFDVFQLSEAWLGGDAARVARMLDGLEAEGEAPVLVLWALAEDIRTLLKLGGGRRAGRSVRDLARELRLWGVRQNLAEPALNRLGARVLLGLVGECARADRQIKGAEEGDAWLTLRRIALRLAAPRA